MYRSLVPLTLTLFAAALLAVPAALAKDGGHHRAVRVQGVCTQQSTSKLKLSREGRRVEVEFEVDQNRAGVPWKVTLRRNGVGVGSLNATTRGRSGSFEIHRLIARRSRADRITALATRTGETCRAAAKAPKAAAITTRSDDGAGHDAGDDHGHDSGTDF